MSAFASSKRTPNRAARNGRSRAAVGIAADLGEPRRRGVGRSGPGRLRRPLRDGAARRPRRSAAAGAASGLRARRAPASAPRSAPSSAGRAGTTSPSAWRRATGSGSCALTSRNCRFSSPPTPVERGRRPCRRRRAQALEHARLVALGLQAADHPGAGVRHRLVVEVDGVLGGEHHPDPEGPGLLEERQDRLLRGRLGRRRHEAEHLVHVDERAQVASCPAARAST